MLEGKTVIVTGANGTLGSAAVRAACDHGAAIVYAVDLDFATPPSNERIVQTKLDLTDRNACETFLSSLSGVDVLFNIAGGFRMGSKAYDVASDDWTVMFKINVDTLRNMIAATTPKMLAQGSGAIVNVGALGAIKGQADMSAYIASKATIMRLTESLSQELAASGINVNAVLPSIIDTPQNRADMPAANHADWVNPTDLANTMCFLGSDLAKAIHGALLPVAGLV